MKLGFTPSSDVHDFESIVEQSQLAERVGFDSLWVSEHHQSANHGPAPLMTLAGLATVTERLELVTSVALLPLRNAVEFAEKCAVLDRISNGRFTAGVGLGYVEEEFEAYGVPMSERAGRFIEGVKLLDRYLSSTEPIDFDSPFWSLSEWQPIPTTVREPRPPLWLGGYGDRSIRRAAVLGDAWLPGSMPDVDGLERRQNTLHEHVAEQGRNWDEMDHPVLRHTMIAPTREKAVELAREYIHPRYIEEYGGDWSHPVLGDIDVADFDALSEGRMLVGSPEDVIEGIEQLRRQCDIDHVGCRVAFAGMSSEEISRQIELLGDEVIPALG